MRVRGWVSAGLRTKDEARKGRKARWRVAKSRMATWSLWILGLKENGDEDEFREVYEEDKERRGLRISRRMQIYIIDPVGCRSCAAFYMSSRSRVDEYSQPNFSFLQHFSAANVPGRV